MSPGLTAVSSATNPAVSIADHKSISHALTEKISRLGPSDVEQKNGTATPIGQTKDKCRRYTSRPLIPSRRITLCTRHSDLAAQSCHSTCTSTNASSSTSSYLRGANRIKSRNTLFSGFLPLPCQISSSVHKHTNKPSQCVSHPIPASRTGSSSQPT